MKVGLALGGGSARGLALIGVIDVLRENGVRIDCVAGTSIGALVGAGLASGNYEALQKQALSMDIWTLLRWIDPSNPVEGLMETEKVVDHMVDLYGVERIEDLSVPFAAVCSDLRTGKEELLTTGSLRKALRASLSIPGLFAPVKFGSKLMVDGGIVNPVPVSAVRKLGADKVIAVDLNHYVLDRDRTPKDRGFLLKAVQKGVLGKSPDIPHIFDMIMDALYLMERSISEMRLNQDPPDVLIRPRVGNISFFDYHRPRFAVDKGRAGAMEALEAIQSMLEE
jgi:NTE family protein